MAITSLADIENAAKQRFRYSKASYISQVIGANTSMWYSTGYPGPGATTGSLATPEVMSNLSVGAIPFVNPPSGKKTHLVSAAVVSVAAYSYELHDRLMQSGPLNTTITTAQALTDFDLSIQAGVSNLAERIGKADYSNVQWWLEWTAASGTGTPTVNFTYIRADGTTGTGTAGVMPASMAAARLVPLIATEPMRGIANVTFTAATSATGNVRVVATLQRTELFTPGLNVLEMFDWARLGLPVIYDSSCLFVMTVNNSTAAQSPTVSLTFAQG